MSLEVRTETPTFGPQPWLAIKTRSGGYHHDNFDTEIPHHEWRYVFDGDTFPWGRGGGRRSGKQLVRNGHCACALSGNGKGHDAFSRA